MHFEQTKHITPYVNSFVMNRKHKIFNFAETAVPT